MLAWPVVCLCWVQDYTIKVQVPQGVTGDNIMTIGKANVNLARYVGEETNTQTDVIPIAFKVGHSSTGYVKVTITSTHLGEVAEDGMTEVSGLTGLTSEGGAATVPEQDLDGGWCSDGSASLLGMLRAPFCL